MGSQLDMAGLTIQEETSHELKPYKIHQPKRVMKGLKERLNPFTMADGKLYCLTTGRATSPGVPPCNYPKIKGMNSSLDARTILTTLTNQQSIEKCEILHTMH